MAITVQSSRPARHRRAVVFCCDGRYLPYALHAACQIDDLNPGRDFDICIATMDDLAIPVSLAHRDFRLCRIATGDALAGLESDERQSPSTYLRLALPEALGDNYGRLLYLDSDIFIQGGDLGRLIGLDIGDHPVAAVRDHLQWRTPERYTPDQRRLDLGRGKYFNAGVILIDIARWTEAGLTEAVVAFGRKHAGTLGHKDQTILNAVLKGRWAELGPWWNWQYTSKSSLFESLAGAHLIHFIGPTKPWQDPDGLLSARFSNTFAAFNALHFQDRPIVRPGASPMLEPARMRKLLWRHYLANRRMARYLARFDHDMSVL